MSANPTIPKPVADLLAAAFPGTPTSSPGPTVGGFSNLTLTVTIGRERCVLKAAEEPARRQDLRREALVLALLRGRSLGAPKVLAFAEGGGWAVLVTRRRPGVPGLTLYQRPPEALLPACEALGRALARLHALALPPPRNAPAQGLLVGERAAALAAALPGLGAPEDLAGRLAEALAHPVWHHPAPRLVHGDAGLHNVLWGSAGLTLLDWELAGWGDPRHDLAWVAWTMRFRSLPPALWEALLAGYGRRRAEALGLEEESLRALALGQIATLLARAAGSPAAWAEWVRRARWTLQLNQIVSG